MRECLTVIAVLATTLALAQDQAPRQSALDAAIGLYNQGKLEEAQTGFRALLDARPDDTAAKYWLAVTRITMSLRDLETVSKGPDPVCGPAAKRWLFWLESARRDAAALQTAAQAVENSGVSAAWALYDITDTPKLLGIARDWVSQQRLDGVRNKWVLTGQRAWPQGLPVYAGGTVSLQFSKTHLQVLKSNGEDIQSFPLAVLGITPPE